MHYHISYYVYRHYWKCVGYFNLFGISACKAEMQNHAFLFPLEERPGGSTYWMEMVLGFDVVFAADANVDENTSHFRHISIFTLQLF